MITVEDREAIRKAYYLAIQMFLTMNVGLSLTFGEHRLIA